MGPNRWHVEVDHARMTGLEYVINQLGLALAAAEQRILDLQAELAAERDESQLHLAAPAPGAARGVMS